MIYKCFILLLKCHYFCPPQVHRWVNYESMLKECLVGRMAVKPSPALQGSVSTFDSIFLWKHNYFHTNMLSHELEMKKISTFWAEIFFLY